MKNGNWVPIDATMAKFLPLDRPYTVIEAIYCLQLNYDKGSTVTVAGLAKLWGWKSRGKVSRFLEAIGVEIVYHKDMEKSRNKRGVLVFSKRTYDEHKTDIERTNNGHIRLINNKWLDYETDIKRAYGGHKTDIGCSTINHTTNPYPEKEKEGENDDRAGNDSLVPLSYLNGDGYSQHMQDHPKEDGKGHNPFPVVNGGDGDNGVNAACEANLNGGILNGTDLDAPGPSLDDDIHPGDNSGSVGGSSSRDGVDGQTPVGEGCTQLDREEVVGDVNTGDNHADQRSDIRSGSSDLPDIGGGVSHGMVGMGDNRRVDTADYGGVSLPDTEVSDDKVGAPEKDENKPNPAKKKAKKPKNGVVLDLSALDAGIDPAIVEEFIVHRNGHKSQKGPFNQRMLDGVIRNAKKVIATHGGTINDALVYTMENGWLILDPKYVKDNPERYATFLEDQHGPLSTDKEIQKRTEDLKRRAQIAQEKWEREHGAVDA